MAVTAYHVDRARTLVPGMSLMLDRAPAMPAGGPDLAEDWSEGVSRWGHGVMLSMAFDGQPVSEWFFELLRRAEFPHLRSRFESIFAMATLEDARAFRHFTGDLSAPIYRVEGQQAHKGNMNLIGWTTPAATTLARAREYWRGEKGVAAPLWELLLEPDAQVVAQVDESQ